MSEQVLPRVAVWLAIGEVAASGDVLPQAMAAGAEGVVLDTGAALPAAVREAVDAIRAVAGGQVIVAGSPAAASEAGAGALLSEMGMSSSEARRLLGPGLPLGREAGSAIAAGLADGVDFVVVRFAESGAAGVRVAVESSWFPVLARVERLDEAAAALAVGAEGVIVPVHAAEIVAGIAAALPRRVDTPATVALNGDIIPLEPDTSVTDLLADAGLAGVARVTVNGVAVLRRAWDERLLAPDDRIEAI